MVTVRQMCVADGRLQWVRQTPIDCGGGRLMKLESCASGGSRERVGNKAVFRGTGTTPGTWTRQTHSDGQVGEEGWAELERLL